MNCKAARKTFSAAFDGELSVVEGRNFGEHLSSCQSCARDYKLFSKSVELVHSLPKPLMNPFFEKKLERALREREAELARARPALPSILRPLEPLLSPLAAVFSVPRPALAFVATLALVIAIVAIPWEQVRIPEEFARDQYAYEFGSGDVTGYTSEGILSVSGRSLAGELAMGAAARGVGGVEPAGRTGRAQVDAGAASSRQLERVSRLSEELGSGVVLGSSPASARSAGDSAVYHVEFILAPVAMQSARSRGVDVAPVSGAQLQPVSLTF
ncbi:MAG: zf-HC2 domain-containing protein [Candidatus Eisenbacteria bacterium]